MSIIEIARILLFTKQIDGIREPLIELINVCIWKSIFLSHHET